MRWSEEVTHIVVIFGMLIAIAHNESNGTTCTFPFKDSGKDFYDIVFFARSGKRTLSWFSTLQLALDKGFVNVDACWKTIDNASNSDTVAFSKGG